MCSSYLLGLKICRLVQLRMLKSKMTTVRIIGVPFIGYLSKTNMTGTIDQSTDFYCCLRVQGICYLCKNLSKCHFMCCFPLRGKNPFEPTPTNEFVVPSDEHEQSIIVIWESSTTPPPPTPAPQVTPVRTSQKK